MATYPIPMSPPVNAGSLYINGLQLSWVSGTAISVAPGQARDARNINDVFSPVSPNPPFDSYDQFDLAHGAIDAALLSVPQAISLSIASNGAGGLDTGTVAADSFYSVYLIGSSAGGDQASANDYVATSAIFSLSAVQPELPAGYDMFRRIGYVLTSGASAILEFDQRGSGSDRYMFYRASIPTDITAGSSAVFAAVDVSDSIPKASIMGIFKCTFTPTGADDPLALRSGDSAVDEGQAVESGSAAGVVKICMMECPVGATLSSGVDYKVTGSAVAINVQGYIDQL